jgi:hypothetical protein
MNDRIEFKRCSCQTGWASREEFVLDPDVQPIGISFAPGESSSRAYFFFNHATCKTTLMIDSEDFADLIEAVIPPRIKAGEKECEGHCTKKEDLETCSAECRNAPFRQFFVDRILKKKL